MCNCNASYPHVDVHRPSQVFTKGIWKSVYLLPVSSTAIDHVTPLIFYGGTYPTAPLTDGAAGPWVVSTRVFFTTPAGSGGDVSGSLTVTGGWATGATVTLPVSLPRGTNASVVANITGESHCSTYLIVISTNCTLICLFVPCNPFSVPVGAAALWWPNGIGAQTLHALSVTFTPTGGSGAQIIQAARRVGFRVFTLVTGNDTVPATVRRKGRKWCEEYSMEGVTLRFVAVAM